MKCNLFDQFRVLASVAATESSGLLHQISQQ